MIFFRADANEQIASGHVMRCISIATCLKKHGEEVCFLIADANPEKMLQEAGMSFINLRTKWNELSQEINEVHNILKQDINPVLFIDTYQVYRGYVESLLPYAKIFYLGSKQEYLGPLHCIINYSADIDKDFYKDHYSSTKLLLGPSYAPIRQEFQNVQEHYDANVFNILLTTGNTDPGGYVPSIIDKLIGTPCFGKITLSVVIGRMFKEQDQLIKNYKRYTNIHFHQNVRSMSELMKMSTLAISANGTTVYELATTHVPVISFSMVEEQVKSASALSALGVVDYAGEIYKEREVCVKRIGNSLQDYYINRDKLTALSKKAYSIIDGKGCERIYSAIKNILNQ